MKIFIAGGNGFIGSHVKQALQEQGDEVTVLSRKRSAGNIQGDVTKPETLTEIKGHNFDAALICVQFPRHPFENPKKGWTYEKVDGEGTENLCRILAQMPLKKIVYMSGAGTKEGRTEPWFRAKLRAEAAVKDACKKNGAGYVIFRPSWIYGPGDRSMNQLIKFARTLPFMPVIGNGNNLVAPLFIEDITKCIVTSLKNSEIKNETVEVGGPEVMTMNQIQKTMLNVLGKRRPLIHQPISLVKMMMPKTAVDFLTMSTDVDSKSAENRFKIKFKTLQEGLRLYSK